jgi:hypothetical protein
MIRDIISITYFDMLVVYVQAPLVKNSILV